MLNTEICRSVNLGGFTLANITKRGNTFRIRVFVGCDMNGKQLVKSTTYTPPDGVTPKKAEKLAQEYAFEFERHCKGYSHLNENMRFSRACRLVFHKLRSAGAERKHDLHLQGAVQEPHRACSWQHQGKGHQCSQADADNAVL